MMVRYAKRMEQLTNSDIGDLLKLIARPDIISFAGGLPAPDLFPVEQLKAACNAVMDECGKVACQYSSTEGFPALREKIAARMKAKNNIETDADHILVTSGSQQGLDFSARVFVDKGDVVLMESPSYLGAINAFKACEPTFMEVPTDDGGMIMEELEKILATTENVKMIYVIPDFQNPTGRTWSLERRHKFMEIINKYEIPVIEDNPYGELRFENENMPALKSLDTKGLVIFLGTFSKILVPGYRLGWVCASEEILSMFNFIKQGADLQTPTITQLEANKYMEMFDLDAHVDTIRELYKHRRDVMMEAMETYLPKEAKFTHPDGGLFTWVELPDYIDTRKMALQCLEKKVAYVPGGSFFPNGGKENCFRMNYSCMPDDKIVEGVKAIAEVIKANLK
ncbi:PLP-dependent aminotransferase family protein [Anaerotignum lactatifermentans]|uniref:PLP-dependent aminotransferase family protein n=2 Tax=Anaerotignum lactatifermentans TaxID=160404 RepID=A0ABS2G7Z4_9FIRM|nr:PLP-dependent aminotransferase family protein [Anaerotignum lactatifermentans]MBM6877310.1 PLP-dependent aminotransferase family protein [Anaerotignum lactatifermentans]MBM6950681.1 PLP-dependent aminotransferase family protein [Anaerotignum lactatifermentans]